MYSLWAAIICAGVINSTQHEACIKSLEAAGLQSGITQETKLLEHNAQKLAESQITWAPNSARFTIATIYEIGINKELVVPLDIPYPFQRMELQGYEDKALIVLKWSF